MKKNYFFLSSLILLATVGTSQSLLQSTQSSRPESRLTDAMDVPPEKTSTQRKVPPPGRNIYFSDNFSSGTPTSLPTGWTNINAAGNSNNWIWSNLAPGGQYSTTIPAMNSTTGTNGYLQLPCDLYNTPFPVGGPAAMDVMIVSPRFNISPTVGSVFVEFQQFGRYCCNISNELVLEVSSDSANWTSPPYDAIRVAPNTITGNGELIRINVSTDLANQPRGWIRFRSTGNSHYFWMIDDVYVFEGPDNQMELLEYELDFHPDFDISPVYKYLPIVNMPIVRYAGITENTGKYDQTNVQLNADVFMDQTIAGGPGTGLVYRASSVVNANGTVSGTVPIMERDTTAVLSPFFTFNPGLYRNRVYVSSDSTFADPLVAEGNYSLYLTHDSVLSLVGDSNFIGSSGPPSYVGGGNDNDAAAALMILDSVILQTQPSVLAKSVSVFVANRAQTLGLQIAPRIWGFDGTQPTFATAITAAPVAGSPFSTTITAAEQGTWVTMPIFPPVPLAADSAYYVGVEQTGGSSTGAELWLGRDVGQEQYAPNISNIYFLNEPGNARWINPGNELTGIRFNGDFTIGLNEGPSQEQFSFEVFPNPNDGQMNLAISSDKPLTYQLNIRNAVGQSVLSEAINVNGKLNRQIDLSSFDKGVYFLSLENGEDRLVKKVVVQ